MPLAWEGSAGLGDLDCDGKSNVIVGAPATDSSAGLLCVALGPLSRTISCAGEHAGPAGSSFGAAVAGVRDVDGRGCDDFVVGASAGSTGEAGAGDLCFFAGE